MVLGGHQTLNLTGAERWMLTAYPLTIPVVKRQLVVVVSDNVEC